MLRLLIARHGNTFDKGDVIRRVGLRTDLDISNSGVEQCLKLASYLSNNYQEISQIFASQLKRTQQTANIILKNKSFKHLEPIQIAKELNEIDYGIDDGKPEKDVIKRIGIEALNAWDNQATVPADWNFDSKKCQKELVKLTNNLISNHQNKTILLITSNGIARFFPNLLKDLNLFNKQHKLKMPTGSISEFIFEDNHWSCRSWAVKP